MPESIPQKRICVGIVTSSFTSAGCTKQIDEKNCWIHASMVFLRDHKRKHYLANHSKQFVCFTTCRCHLIHHSTGSSNNKIFDLLNNKKSISHTSVFYNNQSHNLIKARTFWQNNASSLGVIFSPTKGKQLDSIYVGQSNFRHWNASSDILRYNGPQILEACTYLGRISHILAVSIPILA